MKMCLRIGRRRRAAKRNHTDNPATSAAKEHEENGRSSSRERSRRTKRSGPASTASVTNVWRDTRRLHNHCRTDATATHARPARSGATSGANRSSSRGTHRNATAAKASATTADRSHDRRDASRLHKPCRTKDKRPRGGSNGDCSERGGCDERSARNSLGGHMLASTLLLFNWRRALRTL